MRATVTRVLPMGVRVHLDDGREALLREREMSWEPEERRGWRENFAVGQKFPVVVVKKGGRGELEVSKRLAERDPWLDITRDFPVGAAYMGVVTGVESYGAFIRLKPGVTGLLHRDHWPAWLDKKQSTDQHFGIGDAVYVEVLAIEPNRRRITLGMENLHQHRWREISGETEGEPAWRRRDRPTLLETASRLPSLRVLVVDDEAKERNAIRRYFQQAGQETYTCATAEKAKDIVETWPPQLALIDWHLKEGKNGDGFVFDLRQKFPLAAIYLMSGDVPDSDLMERLRQHNIAFLHRPLQGEDLWEILALSTQVSPLSAGEAPAATQQAAISKRLLRALRRIRSSTRADDVLLFRHIPERNTVEIEGWLDRKGRPRHLHSHPNLVFSPVRQVAELQEPLLTPDILAKQTKQYDRLLDLLKFRGCVGVSVPVDESLPHRALFLFYQYADCCDKAILEKAETEAEAIGWLLELEHQQAQTQKLQGLVLQGRVNRALVHEVNNRLGTIQQELNYLTSACDAFSKNDNFWDKQETEESLQNARRSLQDLLATTRAYAELTRDPTHRFQDVQDIVQRSLQLVAYEAGSSGVQITSEFHKHPIYLRIDEVALQQILLNLMLNAIQNIAEQRQMGRRSQGHIRVGVSLVADSARPVHICVEDDGPGIHARWRQAIFRAGFSSRSEGSGLGLSISRDLARRELDGDLKLVSSAIGWGSRFCLTLPQP
jgi:nitrogen-specific signal transduction histidine kinase/predicted RNA-binding protein with RPS1 domain